jgi:hypothetical protein
VSSRSAQSDEMSQCAEWGCVLLFLIRTHSEYGPDEKRGLWESGRAAAQRVAHLLERRAVCRSSRVRTRGRSRQCSLLTALHRGAACKVDLREGFDIFAHKDRPLDEMRAELGVPPLAALAKAS